MDENHIDNGGRNLVDAPSVENVTVDAPVISSGVRQFGDFMEHMQQAGPIEAEPPVQAQTIAQDAPVVNHGLAQQAPSWEPNPVQQSPSWEPNPAQQAFSWNPNFSEQAPPMNQGYAQQVPPVNQGFAQQIPPMGQGYPAQGQQMNSYSQGYDYGYRKDVNEYGQTDYMPADYYANDPFSSYYYGEDEPIMPQNNGKAIGALVCGIISVTTGFACFGWIPGIIAIPLGIAGLKNSTKKGMARAGLIMGILGTCIGFFMLVRFIIEEFI